MRRKRLLILSLLLLVILLPAGGYFYFQPVRVEDLNRQEWCMCGPREVQFKNGSITLLDTPHPEKEKAGTAIGTYSFEKERLHIAAPKIGGDYRLDHLGAHWIRPPEAENYMGGEFYDVNSWRLRAVEGTKYAWRKAKQCVDDVRRALPVILPALIAGGCVWYFRKSRARKAKPQ